MTTVSLFATIVYIWLAWDIIFAKMVEMFDKSVLLVVGDFRTNAINAISAMLWDASLVMLPVIGVVVVSGFLSNYVQFGSIFAFENIKPKLEKVNPGKGFKRIFSLKQLVETLKSTVKIVFLSILLFFVMREAIGPYINAVPCGMSCLNQVTHGLLLSTFLFTALAFVIVAILDFIYQRNSHTQEPDDDQGGGQTRVQGERGRSDYQGKAANSWRRNWS